MHPVQPVAMDPAGPMSVLGGGFPAFCRDSFELDQDQLQRILGKRLNSSVQTLAIGPPPRSLKNGEVEKVVGRHR